MCGGTQKIQEAFERHKFFWLNTAPSSNLGINGFRPQPPATSPAPAGRAPIGQVGTRPSTWERVGPAQVDTSTTTLLPTDNWPFLYLRERAIPALNVHGMALIAFLSLAILLMIVPARGGDVRQPNRLAWKMVNWQMFFLGAGFMLLETKSVVHMALLFGSTWIVNSFVFAAILLMILISNLWVIKARPQRLAPYYILMIAALLVGAIVPMNTFLALPGAAKVLASCAVTFLPIFFAGVVFATAFRDSEQPDVDFGSNIAGIILGGLCEYSSLAVGFTGLLVIAIVFYTLSYVLRPRRHGTLGA
jgi:hypothetical protein